MYNNTQWFSQTLLTHKDKTYATDGYLRVSLSTNTEDFKFFNAPTINISISNNYQKSVNLNIQNAKDLLRAFQTVISQLNGKELSIQRKYQKDTVLHFTFKLDPNENRIVVIEIRNNETDFVKTVVPLEGVFEALGSCIKEFTDQYMTICSQLFIQSIQSETVQIIHQLPSLIKGISSQIISQESIEVENTESRSEEINEDNYKMTEATIADLDKFLGEDMSNISIPEIKKEEEKIVEKNNKLVEVDSLFVKHYIKNDLENLENILGQLFISKNPMFDLANDINSNLKSYVKSEDFNVLPNIPEDEKKSLVYISKLLSSIISINHFDTGVPVPATVPVLKYNVSTFIDENMDIAYDLLLFNLYIRNVRRSLENKISNAVENKALFYIQLRFFTDPMVFSFLEKVDKTKLTSIILTRYRYYDSIGVFDSYKKLLEEKGCSKITESSIMTSVDEANQKVIGVSPYIIEMHENQQGNNALRVKSKNNLTLEQIINEYLPLEIAEKTGKNLKNDKVINDLKTENNISDEVIDEFTGNKKQNTDTSKIKNSNLERIIRTQFIDEIPEQYKDAFMKYIIELGDKPFDFSKVEFPIDEFGDNVIKALYLWDPISNPVVAKNYKQFFIKVEEELMDRNLILAKAKAVEESIPQNSDWSFLV